MALKGKIEAIIYAAEEPVTLEQISLLLKEPVLQELAEEQARLAAETEASAQQSAAQEVDEPFFAMQESQPEGARIEQGEEEPALEEELGSPESAEPATRSEDDTTVDSLPDSARIETAESPESIQESGVPTAEQGDVPSETAPHQGGEAAAAEAAMNAPPPVAPKKRSKADIPPEVKSKVRALIEELISEYASPDRGIEIRHIAGGYRMATKPEHHDVVKAFAKSLKPPFKLSLPALETLAVVAYKQPVTAPEVSEIRSVDSQGVMATLLDRKLITTAGRKAVIGRPILYKTTKEFLLRFGLKDVSELPSMEEFEKLALEAGQVDMFAAEEAATETATITESEISEETAEEVETSGELGLTPNAAEEGSSGAEAASDAAPIPTDGSQATAETGSCNEAEHPPTEDNAEEPVH